MAWAIVLTESVLARPGTPSTSRWPRARRPTMRRSIRWSCPTITFLISKRSRPVSGGTACCTSAISLSLLLVRRHAERACRCIDGHGETEAAERRLSGGIHEAGDDADDLTVSVHQRAARGPRVHGSVELDKAGQGTILVRHLDRPVESADHAGR